MDYRETIVEISRLCALVLNQAPVDNPPPPPPVETPPAERASYSCETKGDPLNGGHFTYSFALPGEKASFRFEVPAMDARRFTLSGDGGWAEGYVTVEYDGQPVDRQQAIVGPGWHTIVVTCEKNDHTEKHGVGYSTVDLDKRA